MPQEIKRWKCEHCKKHFANKKYAQAHEKKCFFNLDNRTCPTCRHFNCHFNAEYAECNKTNRRNEVVVENDTIFGDVETNTYVSFTDFLIYNCPDWESNCYISEEDEDEITTRNS